MKASKISFLVIFMAAVVCLAADPVDTVVSGPKDATDKTKEINAGYLKALPFMDKKDFEDASRGLIATEPGLVVKNDQGGVIWDMAQYGFIKGDAPDTVNPSLWRQAQLNNVYGLFKVCDHIYQVRGYDLSNISFIEGKTGYIVIDPLVSAEVAKASLELLYKHVGKKPVKAVIYTHSHIDHWGGVKGVVD